MTDLSKTMTAKEVAGVFNVSVDTITRAIKKLYPNLVSQGKTTELDQAQITEVKKVIGTGRHDLRNIAEVKNVTTDFEMLERGLEFTQWALSKIQVLQDNVALLEPKAQIADRLSNSEGTKTLSTFGKIAGVGARKVFEILSDMKIIFRKEGRWQPYQEYVDRGYFILRDKTYADPEGHDHIVAQVYITAKGEVWLAGKLEKAA